MEICIAMKYNGRLRAFSFSYPAVSLYKLIADGNHRPTAIGRSKWKSLIYGSSLQRNCNREGFNLYGRKIAKVRVGIIANEQNNCDSPDSFVGLGTGGLDRYSCARFTKTNAAGNVAQCHPDNGNWNARAMGYILVR